MAAQQPDPVTFKDEGLDLLDLVLPLVEHWKLLVFAPLVVGLLALGITYLIPKTYTSRTVFVPPQQQQGAAASAIAQLGALSGVLGSAAGIKSPADQYVSLLQSESIADRLIERFGLMKVYESRLKVEARKGLTDNTKISLGKRDGLITVEVDDHDAQRSADIANGYVDELRWLTSRLVLSEAQQRRAFFEAQLKQTHNRLSTAQQVLQASGFNQGALKADSRAAAEGYARLRAQVTGAEVRLQTLRRNFADSTPEVQQAAAVMASLRAQLDKLEETSDGNSGSDYVSKFREFKYQEALFDVFSRQYELARVDENRDGALIQVIDPARKPEERSKPRRRIVAMGATLVTSVALGLFVVLRARWRALSSDPRHLDRRMRLRSAWSKP